MIEDDVIRGVRAAREAFGQVHGFNIRAMVADLLARDLLGDWLVVSRPARRPQIDTDAEPGVAAERGRHSGLSGFKVAGG